MNVLIVVESCFGNTRRVAEAVAAGLRAGGASVVVSSAVEAPASVSGFDLVCVGAPTHNLGLPSAKSRLVAGKRGGSAPLAGVAEWLETVEGVKGVRSAAFDTVVAGLFSGSAARKIAQRLGGLGADVAGRKSFTVAHEALIDGELERAKAWAAALG